MGKDVLKLTISKVLTLIITLVTGMFLSRMRSLEEYGTYSQILLVVNLIVSVFSLGMPSSINYFIPRIESEHEKKVFLSTFYSASTVLGIVSGSLLMLFMPLIAKYFQNDLINDFWFVLCILPYVNIIINTASNLLVVYKRSTKLLIFNLISATVLLGAVIIVEIFHLGFFAYMVLYVILESAIAIWVYVIAYKLSKGLLLSINRSVLKQMLIFSIPLGLATSVSTLNSELDKLIIGKLMSTTDVALYSNAAKELPITIIPASITSILLPNIVIDVKKQDFKSAIMKWHDAIEIGYLFVCFCAMICVVFAPQAVAFLYSEKYLPGVNIFRIYGFIMLLRCTYFGMILNAVGKTKFIFYTSIGALVLNIVMNYVLFQIVGFEGPAIATFLSIFLIQFIQLIFTARICKISLSQVFPWKRILSITFVNLQFGLLIYLIVKLFGFGTTPTDIIYCIGVGLISFIVYIGTYFKKIKNLWTRLNES